MNFVYFLKFTEESVLEALRQYDEYNININLSMGSIIGQALGTTGDVQEQYYMYASNWRI